MSLFVKFSKLFYKLAKADYENDVIVIFNTLMFLYKKNIYYFQKDFMVRRGFWLKTIKFCIQEINNLFLLTQK